MNMEIKLSKEYHIVLISLYSQHNFDVISISLGDDTNFILPFWGITQQHGAVIGFRKYLVFKAF